MRFYKPCLRWRLILCGSFGILQLDFTSGAPVVYPLLSIQGISIGPEDCSRSLPEIHQAVPLSQPVYLAARS